MEQKNAQLAAQLPMADRLWAWFDDENNRKRALWGAVVVAGVTLVVGYYQWNQGKKEQEAGEALSQLMTTAIFSGGAQSVPPESYLKMATEHSGTPAAAQAVLLAAGRFFVEGKFADAQTQFQRFTRENPGNPFLGHAMLGAATALEAQGKAEDAARAYKDAGDRFPGSNIAPPARFALGRIYESQDKMELARSSYEEIVRTYSYHSLANEAALRLEEIKVKMPAPAPVTPSAASATPTPATPANVPTTISKP